MTATISDVAAPDGRSIAIGPFGSALKSDTYSSDGVPVLRGQDITDGKALSKVGQVYVPEEVAARFPACIVRKGDLVFPHRGAIGRVGIVSDEELLLSSSMMKLTVDSSFMDPLFVFYYFRGPGRTELLARASTVGTPGIGQPLTSLRSLRISYPPLLKQRAIAEVLGALDDKIAANDRTSKTASSLVLAAVAASQVNGYQVRLSELTSLVTRGIAPRYVESGGVVVVNQKCVRDHWVDVRLARQTAESTVRTDRILHRNDVLVNSTGQGTLGRVARWTRSEIEVTVDSHITIVRFRESSVNPECAGSVLLQLEERIKDLAEGSTGQTELRRDLLGSLELRLPPKHVQSTLAHKISLFDDLKDQLRRESERLGVTRDALLPLLMSGRVRVRDAERVVEDAL